MSSWKFPGGKNIIYNIYCFQKYNRSLPDGRVKNPGGPRQSSGD